MLTTQNVIFNLVGFFAGTRPIFTLKVLRLSWMLLLYLCIFASPLLLLIASVPTFLKCVAGINFRINVQVHRVRVRVSSANKVDYSSLC